MKSYYRRIVGASRLYQYGCRGTGNIAIATSPVVIMVSLEKSSAFPDHATDPPPAVSSAAAAEPVSVPAKAPAVAAGSDRDLRLDLFRGLALWLIFLDHIPSNIVSWITIRNYGFSDATEIFVFISGYTAAFVYGRAMQERGVIVASARILKRAWQVYVAHVFLFAIYMAEISYVSTSFENPLYGEEMGIFDFLRQPDITLVQALMLKFKPVNMDVLPLYIVLLAGFPPMLWILLRAPTAGLGASLLLYLLTWTFGWNLPAYPNGYWVFNPFAWQLLFVFGAWCGLGGAKRLAPLVQSNITLAAAVLYLMFACVITLTWYVPFLEHSVPVPKWLEDWMYPIDKTNLDVLRFAHFMALAVITVRLIPKQWSLAALPWSVAGDRVRPAVARNLLPRRLPVVCRALRHGRNQRGACYADRGQHPGYRHHGSGGGHDFVV